MSQDFFSIFLFHELNHPEALINRLKCLKKNVFFGDIRKISDSVQANTVPSQTPRRLTLCGVRLRTLLACAESEFLIFERLKLANNALSQTPCRLTLRGILPRTILYLQASPGLLREKDI